MQRVDPERLFVDLGGGDTLPYDSLAVATGACAARWLPDALTFTGEREIAGYRALLTAGWAADHEVIGAELEIVARRGRCCGSGTPTCPSCRARA